MRKLAALTVCLLALAGCATTPRFDTAGVDKSLTPRSAVAIAPSSIGQRIQWGGVIVKTRNLRQQTQLEVLAYPLDSDGEPDQAAAPQGRFLLSQQGYLEPVDYAAGRLLTTVGTIARVEHGQVGEADYKYPVVEAAQVHLWPKQTPYPQRGDSNVHFGIGVILH